MEFTDALRPPPQNLVEQNQKKRKRKRRGHTMNLKELKKRIKKMNQKNYYKNTKKSVH